MVIRFQSEKLRESFGCDQFFKERPCRGRNISESYLALPSCLRSFSSLFSGKVETQFRGNRPAVHQFRLVTIHCHSWALQISAVAASSIRLLIGTLPFPPSHASMYCMPTEIFVRTPLSVIVPSWTRNRSACVTWTSSLRFESWFGPFISSIKYFFRDAQRALDAQPRYRRGPPLLLSPCLFARFQKRSDLPCRRFSRG